MTNKTWLCFLLFFVLSASILDRRAFYFDPSIQHWVAKHQNRGVKYLP